MDAVAKVLIGVVALLHAYFLVLEMFLWTTPTGRRVFGLTPEFAEESKSLAANQGLYNGFLVAALVLALVGPDDHRYAFGVYGLVCVVVAGIYGAATVSRRILMVQALPGALALAALLVAQS
jgi:putative membrane protein